MVQSILNSMDKENVNSITDLEESQQIALTIKETYDNLMTDRDWSFLKLVTQLQAVGDLTQPTKIKIPVSIRKIEKLKYNKKELGDTTNKFLDVTYLSPVDFINIVCSRSSDDSNAVVSTLETGVPMVIHDDIAPMYWTSFDDEFIYFDSYDSAVDTTVQASKSLIYAVKAPTFTVDDTFEPDIPEKMLTMLLESARRVCSKRFNQQVDEEAEISSKKKYNSLRNRESRSDGGLMRKIHNGGIKKRR